MKNYSSLRIGGKQFSSRLMVGTGKYKSSQDMVESLSNSETEIITVAVRRIKNDQTGENLIEKINWRKYWMLPNTAGCVNSDEAVRIAILGRELAKLSGQEENNFVKLEVIPDKKYLLPDPIETIKAAEILIKKGFAVLPYINADPILAKRLEEAGCSTVMPLGSSVHCVELYAGRGAQMVRSAGASAQVMAKEGDYVALKLPSTEVRLVRKECYATLGEVGNSEIRNTSLGKAGRRRWLGRRPQVRGSVMNPCDHPHGGGEGKAPIGRAGPVTPWGKPALGLKTRKKNKPSNKLVVRRRRRVSKRSRGGRDS